MTCLIIKIWVILYDVKEKQRHCDTERALRNRGKRKGNVLLTCSIVKIWVNLADDRKRERYGDTETERDTDTESRRELRETAHTTPQGLGWILPHSPGGGGGGGGGGGPQEWVGGK